MGVFQNFTRYSDLLDAHRFVIKMRGVGIAFNVRGGIILQLTVAISLARLQLCLGEKRVASCPFFSDQTNSSFLRMENWVDHKNLFSTMIGPYCRVLCGGDHYQENLCLSLQFCCTDHLFITVWSLNRHSVLEDNLSFLCRMRERIIYAWSFTGWRNL